jgi:hypothetical protein
VAQPDSSSNNEYTEISWDNPLKVEAETTNIEKTETDHSPSVIETTSVVDRSPSQGRNMNVTNPERELTYLFMTLSFQHQMGILHSLELFTEDCKSLSGSKLIKHAFSTARSNKLLHRLWEETAKHHSLDNTANPFLGR